MTIQTSNLLERLEAHLASTKAKVYQPTAPDYKQVEQCFVEKPVQTLGIIKPQDANEVASVLRFCIENNVDFSVRSGGHDCAARTLVDGALVVDMRDIKYVKTSEDKRSARIGGGILLGELSRALGEEGLATPTGTVASVGYTGWSTLGGYGTMTSHYGMGVDQIIGAQIVNARGELQTADEELLVGIRGGGGSLGIITELTIKAYPVNKILYSTIVYESSNLETALTSYTRHYEQLLEAGELPVYLQLQPMITDMPGQGVVFAVLVAWHGVDKDEGLAWVKNIAGAGNCVMEMTQEVTPTELVENNEKLITWPSRGRVLTLNVKKLTAKTISVIAKYCSDAPGGGLIFSYHSLLSAEDPKQKSVFGTRDRHHMLEIYALPTDQALVEDRVQWGARAKAELEREDTDNILEGSYISLGSHEDADPKRVYGRHYETLAALKRKHDPTNVFKNSIPRLVLSEDKSEILEV
ncbi:hypothetical protein ACHAPU_006328 [Fusarium lateritium]